VHLRENYMPDKKVVDIHVHIGGTGDSGSGCKMSPQFIFSPAFVAMLIALKASPFEIKDEKIEEIILGAINSSQKIDYAVLLALDGVYRDGQYIEHESHLVVPNDYVTGIADKNERILFGASVHPYRERTEMLTETKRCIDKGAVLFKWIPSAQQIDPEDEKCVPFYELLAEAENEIPLLCHTGAELAVPTSHAEANDFNDPQKLKMALDKGVKVIACHCAAPYLGGILPADKDYFGLLMDMLKKAESNNWKLFADISAFCTPTRIPYLRKINECIENGSISPARFLFGSDFPIPIIDINMYDKPLDFNEMIKHLKDEGNPLDNNYYILREFGIHESILTNAWDVIRH
jgi:predicted TIM-barrel fold metal-dependent hydrolase